jgi:hypothetical protein
VVVAWDWGGGSQSIILSSKGDEERNYDVSCSLCQFTGDGSKKIQIIIINNNQTQSPYVGGEVRLVKL